jgi:hypothetical protein
MRSIKLYAGIDYDFRPESYWGPARNPLEAALRNVKGRNRREMIRDYHSNGLLPALSDNLLRDTLEEDTRRRLDLIHPSFMGGEYLPDYRRDEVEIARIELQSTTCDVISIRGPAQGQAHRIFGLRRVSSGIQAAAKDFAAALLAAGIDSFSRLG